MRSAFDPYLRQGAAAKPGALGRDFSVTQESWSLAEDPAVTRPRRRTLASGKTASEAADLARNTATAEPQHGFHKPSGAWWAADEASFHRFVVHPDRRGGAVLLLAVGAVGVGIGLLKLRKRGSPA